MEIQDLCRICLVKGATLPIFENLNIHSKLLLCFREKIEDVYGLPRNICHQCKDTLESVCDFINKYKESHKILEAGLHKIKQERLETLEVGIGINDIKTETIDDYDVVEWNGHDEFAELLKPLQVTVKKKKMKSETRRTRSGKTYNTNMIASSILEEEFLWTGEKWCYKSKKKLSKKQVPSQIKGVRQKKLEIPKMTKPRVIEMPPKLCDICGQTYKSQDQLTRHKNLMHLPRHPAQCKICKRFCANEFYLRRHIRRRHETEKTLLCNVCGKAFAFKKELMLHVRNVHEKDKYPAKLFSCKLCNKTYKVAKSLLVHERSAHTGDRPAVCTICDTSFFHEDYLKEHMRLHTGETPFKCPICGRGYAQNGNMKSHLRNHRISDLDKDTLAKIRPSYFKFMKQ